MQWVYLHELPDRVRLPVFISLRSPSSLDDLNWFVDRYPKETGDRKNQLLLLVDGYDEISYEQRREVSELLIKFRSLNRGVFWLTCRSHYDVFDLPTTRYEVSPFSHAHAVGFVRAFLSAYGSRLNPETLLAELIDRGFDDFIAHPLMLSLVCILKTSANVEIPRRTIGLVRRAIEILSFRWDEAKGINRQSMIPLDSDKNWMANFGTRAKIVSSACMSGNKRITPR